MWAKDRHHRIVSLLATRERVSLENLAAEFGVSRETLRRDIVQLEAEGRLKRVHGGFMRIDGAEPPFQSRVMAHADAKRRIAAAAARLVKPGMLIAIDAGSTTLALSEFLAGIPRLNIITNSLGLAAELHKLGGETDVMLLGGRLAPDVPATFGEITIGQLQRFQPQLAMLSPVSLDATRGAMDYDLAEAEVARTMAENAARLVLLADHSKLGTTSRVQICGIERVDTLVTDRKAAPDRLAALTAAGVREVIRA